MTADDNADTIVDLERRAIRALDDAVLFASAARALYSALSNKQERMRLDHVLYHFAKASRAMTEPLNGEA